MGVDPKLGLKEAESSAGSFRRWIFVSRESTLSQKQYVQCQHGVAHSHFADAAVWLRDKHQQTRLLQPWTEKPSRLEKLHKKRLLLCVTVDVCSQNLLCFSDCDQNLVSFSSEVLELSRFSHSNCCKNIKTFEVDFFIGTLSK